MRSFYTRQDVLMGIFTNLGGEPALGDFVDWYPEGDEAVGMSRGFRAALDRIIELENKEDKLAKLVERMRNLLPISGPPDKA